jgi:hypothetical protein
MTLQKFLKAANPEAFHKSLSNSFYMPTFFFPARLSCSAGVQLAVAMLYSPEVLSAAAMMEKLVSSFGCEEHMAAWSCIFGTNSLPIILFGNS